MDYTEIPPELKSKIDKLKVRAYTAPVDSEVQYKDRLNVNVMVVHEHWGDRPVSHECHHAYLLDSTAQPIPRRRMVVPSDKWVSLELVWLEPKDVGLIVLENLAGKNRRTNPTEEQIVEIKNQLVLVRARQDGGNLILRPGVAYPLEFENIEEVSLRSATVPTEISVSIYPK